MTHHEAQNRIRMIPLQAGTRLSGRHTRRKLDPSVRTRRFGGSTEGGMLNIHQYSLQVTPIDVHTVRCNIPSRTEDQKVRKRCCWIPRWCSHNAEDRRINVIHRDRPDVDKLCQIVLVRNIVPMPCHNIKRRVLLRAFEKPAAELVQNLPSFLLDFVSGSWVQEVAGICETVGSEGTKSRQLET